MKITSINIPENFFYSGLCKINMSRLGEIVIIAGKNGSGKTRLLRGISFHLKHSKMKKQKYNEIIKQINSWEERIKEGNKYTDVEECKNEIEKLNEYIKYDSSIELDCRLDEYFILEYVPNKLDLQSPEKLTGEEKN